MTHKATITLAGGCFWCLDAAYRQVKGVSQSVCGYAGGHTPNPTYEQLHATNTGHAEAVQLTYDPDVISLSAVLEIFWVLHDPTTLNRQGNDIGPEYRSMILYQDAQQQHIAETSRQEAQKLWPDPIVTQIVPLEAFYEAEPEHQNYFARHPESAYCQVVINPKLQKLQHKFQQLLRD